MNMLLTNIPSPCDNQNGNFGGNQDKGDAAGKILPIGASCKKGKFFKGSL